MPNDKNYFFLWPGILMYVGAAMDTDIHKHHVVQLILTLNNPITMITPTTKMRVSNVIIDTNQSHHCRVTPNTRFILLNIDPLTSVGKTLKANLLTSTSSRRINPEQTKKPNTVTPNLQHSKEPTTGIRKLNPKDTEAFITAITKTTKKREFTSEDIRKHTLHFLARLTGNDEPPKTDPRIEKTISIIKARAFENPTVHELAKLCHLSPSRLIHLFTKEVGIPIRRYILWIRVMNAIKTVFESSSLQTAALASGFSDAPHFNRTFKRMFGLPPTAIMKNSQSIQPKF